MRDDRSGKGPVGHKARDGPPGGDLGIGARFLRLALSLAIVLTAVVAFVSVLGSGER